MTYGLRNSLVLALVVLTSLSAACAHQPAGVNGEAKPLHGDEYVETLLVFGLSGPGGKVISEREWQYFVDTYVTPRFKEGLTVIDSNGQWMMKTGEVIKEKSKVMILLYDKDSAEEINVSVEYIKEAYKKLFQQEAVLCIDTAAGVSF